jgi:hypothetical protein
MEKEFIPYKQALALKELGFDEPCFGRYYYKESYPMLNPNSGETELVFEFGQYIKQTEITILAPLYQQAFSFLLNIIKDVSITYWNDESGNLKYFGQVNPFYDFDNRKECLSVLIEIAKKN